MKTFYLLLFFFAVSFSAYAQSSFGIRAGLNYSTQSVDEISSEELEVGSVVGYHLGFNYEIAANEHFAVRPGLIYSLKGSKTLSTSLPTNLNSEVKLGYIEIPVDFVFDLTVVDLYLGPYLSYALGGTITVGDAELEFDFDDLDLSRTDYGLTFGANIDILDRLYLGAQYQFGMGNISDIDDRDDDTVKNQSFSTFITFRF